MEQVTVLLGDEAYDEAVHGADAQGTGDLKVCVKEGAMVSGAGAVAIAFTVILDGQPVRVQTVTSLKAFLATGRTLAARYDDTGRPRPGAIPRPKGTEQ